MGFTDGGGAAFPGEYGGWQLVGVLRGKNEK